MCHRVKLYASAGGPVTCPERWAVHRLSQSHRDERAGISRRLQHPRSSTQGGGSRWDFARRTSHCRCSLKVRDGRPPREEKDNRRSFDCASLRSLRFFDHRLQCFLVRSQIRDRLAQSSILMAHPLGLLSLAHVHAYGRDAFWLRGCGGFGRPYGTWAG